MTNEFLLQTVFVLVLTYSFLNGYLDGGSLVSTVVSSRVLSPISARLLVAFFEIVGLLFLGHHVAETVRFKMLPLPATLPATDSLGILIAALVATLFWNITMWKLSLPSSSSHALMGALAGSLAAHLGWQGVPWRIFASIFLLMAIAPIVASALGFLLTKFFYLVGAYLTPASKHFFEGLQLLALAGVAMVHGSNDGQKSLGLLWVGTTVIGHGTNSLSQSHLTLWCGATLAFGVLGGSLRMMKTVGKKLYRVQSLQSFCSETATVAVVGLSSWQGYPISTTHVISTSVLGVGAAVHPRGVRWDIMADMALAWVVTIPCAGILAFVLGSIGKGFLHVVS